MALYNHITSQRSEKGLTVTQRYTEHEPIRTKGGGDQGEQTIGSEANTTAQKAIFG